MKKTTDSVKKFADKHKVAITVVTTTVVYMTISKYAMKQHNDFLKEKGLYDEFYFPKD